MKTEIVMLMCLVTLSMRDIFKVHQNVIDVAVREVNQPSVTEKRQPAYVAVC